MPETNTKKESSSKESKKKKENEKKISKLSEPEDYKIDNTSSLWNQLRQAWYDYHNTKNKLSSEDQGKVADSNLRRYEILIENLLKELGIESNPEVFKVTVDHVPEFTYRYGTQK